MEQVMHMAALFQYIIEFIPRNGLIFFHVSRYHRDIVQELYINQYISYLKGDSPIPHHSVVDILNIMIPTDKSLLYIRSHVPSFMSLRKPILPLFKNYVIHIHAQNLLSGIDDSISRRVLLHMDQCMYNYSNINNSDIDDTITKLLSIAHSYIAWKDVRDVHDIQPHHRYVIMKESEMLKTSQIDVIMANAFDSSPDLELVIDFRKKPYIERLNISELSQKFCGKNCVQHISIMGENLKTIDDDFLNYCHSLMSITIPNTITRIGNNFLFVCTSLKSIQIPDSVTHIGYNFLRKCISLTTINIPDSVTHIGNDFLCDCTSLTSINIPNSVTHIGNKFLCCCRSLTSIKIPDSVTHIGDDFIIGCTSVTYIHIPDSVTRIREKRQLSSRR
jgi:hypothetical protein